MKLSLLSKKTIILLVFTLALPINVVFSAPLIFSAPPRESAQAGKKLYEPIAAYLSKLFGETVTYVHPVNWLKYQREMRNGKYDIVVDGPHFASWRIVHLGHEAVVKLPGTLQFMLLADKSNSDLDHADKLIGKKICGISPPHLSTLSVLDKYRNPVRQPVIKGIKGGMGKVLKAYSSEKAGCSAMVLRNKFFNKKVKKEQREKLKVLFLSKAMPNQTITVSKRVSVALKDKMRYELTKGAGVASAKGFVKRFAPKAKSLVPVKEGEYDGYNMLLEGIIFGW